MLYEVITNVCDQLAGILWSKRLQIQAEMLERALSPTWMSFEEHRAGQADDQERYVRPIFQHMFNQVKGTIVGPMDIFQKKNPSYNFV